MRRLTFSRIPWIWGFLAAAVVLACIMVVSGQGGEQTLSLALSLAPYLVLVAIGQMLVVTVGPGNIDVAVGPVISLAGFVSVGVTYATGSVALGLGAGIGVGMVVATVSLTAILWLAVPPIIATLAAGLMASSFSLMLNQNFTAYADSGLRAFLDLRPGGVPLIAVAVAGVTALVALALRGTVPGRALLAVGQNRRAAERAGLPVARIVASAYLASGALAGLAGSLLAVYVLPSPEIGANYLLDSVAVVVVGGTLLSGGRAVPLGLWGGALFFILLEGLLSRVGWEISGQNILKGVLLLIILSLAAGGVTGTQPRRRIRPLRTGGTAAPDQEGTGAGDA
jgi:ribose transport system permease protein